MDLGEEKEIVFFSDGQEVMDHSCASSPPLHLNLACVLILLGTFQSWSSDPFMSFHIYSIYFYSVWEVKYGEKKDFANPQPYPWSGCFQQPSAWIDFARTLPKARSWMAALSVMKTCNMSFVRTDADEEVCPSSCLWEILICCRKAVDLIVNMRMLSKGLNLVCTQAITHAPWFSISAAVAGYLTRWENVIEYHRMSWSKKQVTVAAQPRLHGLWSLVELQSWAASSCTVCHTTISLHLNPWTMSLSSHLPCQLPPTVNLFAK